MSSFYETLEAIQNEYSKGDADFTVTDLNEPPRIAILKKAFGEKRGIENSLPAILGNAIHNLFEKYSPDTVLNEQRVYGQFGDIKLGGKFDWLQLEDGILSDVKTARADSFSY
jgi:hypothetical protein